MKTDIRIQWNNDLTPRLQALGKDSAVYRVISRGTRAAASVVNREVKAIAPREFGLLKKSIGVKNVPRKALRKRAFALSIIGPRWNVYDTVVGSAKWTRKPRFVRPARYATLVEGGTAPHTINQVRRSRSGRLYRVAVRHPGTPAQRFMERATQRTVSSVRSAMAHAVQDALESEAKRNVRRGK